MLRPKRANNQCLQRRQRPAPDRVAEGLHPDVADGVPGEIDERAQPRRPTGAVGTSKRGESGVPDLVVTIYVCL